MSRVIVRIQLPPELDGVNLPQCHEERHHDRSQDKSRKSEEGKPAERREKNDERVHLRILADEPGLQDIVDEGYDAESDTENERTLPKIPQEEEYDTHREPDRRRSDHRDNREEEHKRRPDERR